MAEYPANAKPSARERRWVTLLTSTFRKAGPTGPYLLSSVALCMSARSTPEGVPELAVGQAPPDAPPRSRIAASKPDHGGVA